MKDDDNKWDVRGHRDRLLVVDEVMLRLFAKLLDGSAELVASAKLPPVHSRQLVEVLQRLSLVEARVASLAVFPHYMWDESRAKKAGTIAPHVAFATRPDHVILSGPHFYVANPFAKTPRRVCTSGNHYDSIDLQSIPATYLPRTVYAPAAGDAEYASRIPRVSFAAGRPVTDYYRIAANRALNVHMERSLQAAIVPPGFGHIDAVYTYAFERDDDMLRVAAYWSSLPLDFLVKVTGAGDLRPNVSLQLPVGPALDEILARVLLLNCVTELHAALWERHRSRWSEGDHWSKSDRRLSDDAFARLRGAWSWQSPLRTDFERRQALVELDVLCAHALGVSLEQLLTVYRAQFPILRSNELDTWYDQTGRIVFTVSKGLAGVGLDRTRTRGDSNPAWEDVEDLRSGTVRQTIADDTQPGGPRERTIAYEAPFDRCDREQDYSTAWAHFAKRFGS